MAAQITALSLMQDAPVIPVIVLHRTEHAVPMAEALLGADRITWKERPAMGVEDFSFLVKARAGAFYHLGCGNPDKGITAPAHSSTFDIDEDCLVLGAAMQAGLAMAYLSPGGNP